MLSKAAQVCGAAASHSSTKPSAQALPPPGYHLPRRARGLLYGVCQVKPPAPLDNASALSCSYGGAFLLALWLLLLLLLLHPPGRQDALPQLEALVRLQLGQRHPHQVLVQATGGVDVSAGARAALWHMAGHSPHPGQALAHLRAVSVTRSLTMCCRASLNSRFLRTIGSQLRLVLRAQGVSWCRLVPEPTGRQGAGTCCRRPR